MFIWKLLIVGVGKLASRYLIIIVSTIVISLVVAMHTVTGTVG